MLGARILRSVPFLAPHIPIVELHHERPDGRGYPHGLRGDDIPLAARIVHVADAYDAMTSARAYRAARPSGDALRELWRCAGTEFHAEIVGALATALPGVTSDDRATSVARTRRSAAIEARLTAELAATIAESAHRALCRVRSAPAACIRRGFAALRSARRRAGVGAVGRAFSLDSVVAVDEFGGENASNRPQIIVDMSLAVRIGDRWQVYVRPWFRLPRPPTPTAPAPDWDKEIYQAGLRYERPGDLSTRVDVGYILSPIGLGIFDTRPGVNPTIGRTSATSARCPRSIRPGRACRPSPPRIRSARRSAVSTRIWDARAAVINSAPTRVYVARRRQQSAADAGDRRRRRRDADHRPAARRVGRARRLRHARRDHDAGPRGRRMTMAAAKASRRSAARRSAARSCAPRSTRRRTGDRVRVVRPGHADAVAALVRRGAARRHIRPAARQRHRRRHAAAASPRSKRPPAFASRRDVTLRSSYYGRRSYGALHVRDQVGVSIVWAGVGGSASMRLQIADCRLISHFGPES